MQIKKEYMMDQYEKLMRIPNITVTISKIIKN